MASRSHATLRLLVLSTLGFAAKFGRDRLAVSAVWNCWWLGRFSIQREGFCFVENYGDCFLVDSIVIVDVSSPVMLWLPGSLMFNHCRFSSSCGNRDTYKQSVTISRFNDWCWTVWAKSRPGSMLHSAWGLWLRRLERLEQLRCSSLWSCFLTNPEMCSFRVIATMWRLLSTDSFLQSLPST